MADTVAIVYDPVSKLPEQLVIADAKQLDDPAFNPPGKEQLRMEKKTYDLLGQIFTMVPKNLPGLEVISDLPAEPVDPIPLDK